MKLRSFWHFNRLTFFCLDYVLLWGAVVCAFKLSPRYVEDIVVGFFLLNREIWFMGYGLAFFMALGLQVTDMQRSRAGFKPSETIARTFAGLAGGLFCFVLLHAVVEFSLIGRFVLFFSLCYGTALIVGSRLVLGKLAEQQKRQVLVYGPPQAAGAISAQLAGFRVPVRLVGCVNLSDLAASAADADELAKLRLYSHCEKLAVDEVVVDVSRRLSPVERDALLFCTGMGVSVVEIGYFFERELERVYLPGLNESWFWGYDPAHAHPAFFAIKRTLDVVISLAGMLTFLPFAPFVCLFIKLQDGGPVLYSQVRVGLHNQPFRIFKFRTMRVDAESGGAQWAKRGDNRVTWFGRIMRRTRLDEVPQFWNILTGEMSFIGPRPERPEMAETIEKDVPFFRYRHMVKPGLTGWAQINYPYGASIEDTRQKLSFDFHYLKYASITRELHIMLRTIVAMVQGAR